MSTMTRTLQMTWKSTWTKCQMPNMLKASNVPVIGIFLDAALFLSRYPPLTIPTQRCRKRYRTWSSLVSRWYVSSAKCEPWKILYTLTQTYYLAVQNDLSTLVSSNHLPAFYGLTKNNRWFFKNNSMSSLHSVMQEADIDPPPRCWYRNMWSSNESEASVIEKTKVWNSNDGV